MYNIFIHSSVDGHLGHFHVLAIVNSAAVTAGAHVSFGIMVFSGYMPRSGIAGSYGSSLFSFLKLIQPLWRFHNFFKYTFLFFSLLLLESVMHRLALYIIP